MVAEDLFFSDAVQLGCVNSEEEVTEEFTDDSGSSSPDALTDSEYEDTDEFMSPSQAVLEASDEEWVPNSSVQIQTRRLIAFADRVV